MPKNFESSEGHSFVDPAEAEEQAEIKRQRREISNYLGRATELRVNIYEKLKACQALGREAGWAIFDIDKDELTSSNISDIANRKEIALISYVLKAKTDEGIIQFPVIRVQSREYIESPGGVRFLNYDFSLDAQGNAQYLVGGHTPLFSAEGQEDQFSHLPPDDRPPEPTEPGMLIPLFYVDEGNIDFLGVPNALVVTCDVSFYVDDQKLTAAPFGERTSWEDKLQALSIGEALFTEVASREPAFHRQAA